MGIRGRGSLPAVSPVAGGGNIRIDAHELNGVVDTISAWVFSSTPGIWNILVPKGLDRKIHFIRFNVRHQNSVVIRDRRDKRIPVPMRVAAAPA